MTSLDFKGTLKESIDFLGGTSLYTQEETPEQIALREKRAIEALRIAEREQQQKKEHIQAITKDIQPIAGTLAERYLREHRGITHELNSDNLRFHPALKNWANGQTYPALVILSHDSDKNICGVQATFLNPTTANKAALEGAVKLSRGLISHGTIVHHAISDNPTKPTVIAFAEGSETALSVAEAHPDWEVRLTFGVSNFEKAITAGHAENKDATFVICADNDGIDSGTDKAVKKTVAHLAEKGIIAHVVEPTKPDGIEKWDFNDQLKQNGIEAVRQDLDGLSLNLNAPSPTIETMSKELKTPINKSNPLQTETDSQKPPRTPWPENFPEVIVHTSVKERDAHPDYANAKNGDIESAFKLINDMINPEKIEAIREQLKGEKPIIVAVSAQEAHGENVIPDALANHLARVLGTEVDQCIYQANYVNHTRNSAFHRMAYPATFGGEVQKGKNYLIVDDHVGVGGTLANLKGYIEKNGGSVILTTTLTASHNSQYLAPKQEDLAQIKARHGEALEIFLKNEIGHSTDELTKAEVGQLLKAKSLDEIRNRFHSAKEKGSLSVLSRTLSENELKNSKIHLSPEQEEQYKDVLRSYQKLKAVADDSMLEDNHENLRSHAHGLKKNKELMDFTERKYPKVYSNITSYAKEYLALENLSPKQEEKFKNCLKHYKAMNPDNSEKPEIMDRPAFLKYANILCQNQLLMRFTHKNYPNVYDNIQSFSNEYLKLNQTHKRKNRIHH